MRFRSTADLLSLLEANVPKNTPDFIGVLSFFGASKSQRIVMVFPFHTLPFLWRKSFALRPWSLFGFIEAILAQLVWDT